jgi:hypothetical protein
LNISKPASGAGSGYGRISRYYGTYNAFGVFEPGTNYLSWDWKYSDTIGVGPNQYAFLRVTFTNSSTYRLYIYMGRGDDYVPSNSSTIFYVKAPGFGLRDTWVHSEIDLYAIAQEVGIYNLLISELQIEASQGVSYAGLEFLVDNFQMKTYPMSNPTFEAIDPSDTSNLFPGWYRYSGLGEVTQSTVAHGGSYSANITVEDGYDGFYRYDVNFEFDSHLSLDYWWRLEDIQDTGEAYAVIQLEFISGMGNRFIRYLLGSSSLYSATNTSTVKYITVDGFNQTGIWTLLSRNVTADIEDAFSTSPLGWETYQLSLFADAGPGMRTTLLVDDLHLKDTQPPSVDLVSFDPTPMYFEDVLVRISTTDIRPGVSTLFVVYSIDDWFSVDVSVGMYDEGDWYNATIPAQDYSTQVDFYIQVTDGCGVEKIDDNGGLFYSYLVDDDVNPTLTITNPANNTDQEGMLTIIVDAMDAGTGIEYVTFDPDVYEPSSDNTAPYSYDWNLDSETLGLHYIDVAAYDGAGNSVTKRHYFTVVDTTVPEFSMTPSIVMELGQTGVHAIWDPTDLRPDSYEVFVDEVLTYSGNWNSSFETIRVLLDGLPLGSYNYTCVVYDDGGNSVSEEIQVTVVDWTAPTITGPDDFAFTVGATGQSISWNGTDLDPDYYVILENGITVASNDWNSSLETISYSLEGLATGTYNYSCVIYDGTGNYIVDTVIITVNAEITTPTSSTPTTSDTTPTTSATTPLADDQTVLLLVVFGAGGIAIVIAIVAVAKKRA